MQKGWNVRYFKFIKLNMFSGFHGHCLVVDCFETMCRDGGNLIISEVSALLPESSLRNVMEIFLEHDPRQKDAQKQYTIIKLKFKNSSTIPQRYSIIKNGRKSLGNMYKNIFLFLN